MMKKSKKLKLLYCLLILFSLLWQAEARAAFVESLELKPENKNITITGACEGRAVAVHIFQPNASDPFYTAGTECKNGVFNFNDDLGYWKINQGSYRVVVYDENSPLSNPSPAEEFRIENAAAAPTVSGGAVLASENELATSSRETGGTAPGQDANSSHDVILQKITKAFQSMEELVKKALASLGFFVENGIAKVTELIAGKITADEASIKNLEVSETLQLRDRNTGESYCVWLENGEWAKVKSPCGDSTDDQTPNSNNQTPNNPPDSTGQVNNDDQSEQSNEQAPVEETSSAVELSGEAVEPPQEVLLIEETPEPAVVEPAEEAPAVSEVEPPKVIINDNLNESTETK